MVLKSDLKSSQNDPVHAEGHACVTVGINLAWTISTRISPVTIITILWI